MLRLGPTLTIIVLIGPVAAGLLGSALPAFGYLPALGGQSFNLDAWRELFSSPGIGTSAAISLTVGLVTTGVSLTAVLTFIAAWHGTRMFAVLQHLLSPILSIPHAATAIGLAFLVAPSGWVMRLVSPWPSGFERPPDLLIVHDPLAVTMMTALVIKEIPFLFLMALAALPQTRAQKFTHIAAGFGYGRVAGWWKTVLPRLYPQIRLPVYAVIAYASSVVDVALILGPTTPPPLAVQVIKWTSDPDVAMRFKASAGAIAQLGVTGSALAIWWLAEQCAMRLGRVAAISGRRWTADGLVRIGSAVVMTLSVAAIVLGLAGLGLWSIAGLWQFPQAFPPSLTLRTWAVQLPNAGEVIWTTIAVAVLATAIAIVLTLACLERETRSGRSIDIRALVILYVPLLVPQIAFLFGLQVLTAQLGLDNTFAVLVLSHLIFVMPYVFLALGDPWRAWDPRYGQMAYSLGKSPDFVFWHVRLPMLLRPVLTAAAVGLAVSIGQYLPTLLIGGGRWPTLTTEAVALAAGGNRRVIGVYAIVQTILPFLGFALALLIPAIVYRKRQAMRVAP
jgi:putative thiamine transport system permease protein